MYDYKKGEEFLWFVGTAGATFMLGFLTDFYPEKIQDWHLWVVSLGAGLIRALAAAGLSFMGRIK